VCGFYVDPTSSLGRLHLLTKQDAELVSKQQSLESEMQRQSAREMELQDRAKSASLHPEELSSLQLSSLFHETQC